MPPSPWQGEGFGWGDVSLPHPGGKVPPKGADEGELQRAVGLLLLRQPLIHPHQLRHAGAFAVQLSPKAVCLHHGLVVLLVGLAQLRGHGRLVIQIGKTAIRVELPGIQNRLCGLLDPGLLLVRGRGPGEVVVNVVYSIAIIAF